MVKRSGEGMRPYHLDEALAAIARSTDTYVTEAMIRINGGAFITGAELEQILPALLASGVLKPKSKDHKYTINRKALAVMRQRQIGLFDDME